MAEEFVLVVSDESDGKQGEISVLDTAHETERLVETLLESGIDQNRIRVFAGAEAEFETIYRPVVNLFDEPNETAGLDRPVSDKAGLEATEVRAEAEREAVKAHSGNGSSRGSVRPSSLFRSARDDDSIDVYISASEAAS
jgi:hypothetical protein